MRLFLVTFEAVLHQNLYPTFDEFDTGFNVAKNESLKVIPMNLRYVRCGMEDKPRARSFDADAVNSMLAKFIFSIFSVKIHTL